MGDGNDDVDKAQREQEKYFDQPASEKREIRDITNIPDDIPQKLTNPKVKIVDYNKSKTEMEANVKSLEVEIEGENSLPQQNDSKIKLNVSEYLSKYKNRLKTSDSKEGKNKENNNTENLEKSSSSKEVSSPTRSTLDTQVPCEICDIWFSKRIVKYHRLEHFIEEMDHYILNSCTDMKICHMCNREATDMRMHLAFDHGILEDMLQKLKQKKRADYVELDFSERQRLNDANESLRKRALVEDSQEKQNEFVKRLKIEEDTEKDENIDFENSQFCGICKKEIGTNMIRHLGVHVILLYKRGIFECPKCLNKLEHFKSVSEYKNHLLEFHDHENTFKIAGIEIKLDEKYCAEMNSVIRHVAKDHFCYLCEDGVPATDLNSHIAKHFHPLALERIKDEEPYECALCDGFPDFEDFESLSSHHLAKHFSRVENQIDHYLAEITNMDKLLALRSRLNIDIIKIPLPKRLRNDSCKSSHSSISFSSVSIPESPATSEYSSISTNSRRSQRSNKSPGFYSKLSKGQIDEDKSEIVKGTSSKRQRKSIEDSLEMKSDSSNESLLKELCAYCTEGYFDADYYKHMACEHFREIFIKMLPDSAPFTCPRCIFNGDDLEDLIIHFAEYHKVLEFILKSLEDGFEWPTESKLEETKFFTQESLSDKYTIFKCSLCNFLTENRPKMGMHIINHMKDVAEAHNLTKEEPFICPKCFYESSTYTSLLRHYFCKHDNIDVEKSVYKYASATPPPKRRKFNYEPCTDPNLTGFHVSFHYGKNGTNDINGKNEKAVESSVNPSNFNDLITSLIGNVTSNQNCDTESTESTEKPELNNEATYSITSHQKSESLYPKVSHSWLCDGRLLLLKEPLNPHNMRLFQVGV